MLEWSLFGDLSLYHGVVLNKNWNKLRNGLYCGVF